MEIVTHMSFMVELQEDMETTYGEPDTSEEVCPVRREGAENLLKEHRRLTPYSTKEHKCIEEAYKRLDYMSQDEVIRAAAVAREKLRWDIEAGKEARYEEGIEVGREEGLIEAAKKLIASGMEPNTVCDMLGISESDLD